MDFVAVFIDGKYLAKQQINIALGITLQGDKMPLGFVQTTTENSMVIGSFLNDLINRGLKYDEGLLFIVDGSKGMKKAIHEVFEHNAIFQRCTWRKRESILSFLPENLHAQIKSKYNKALHLETYQQGKAALLELVNELKKL